MINEHAYCIIIIYFQSRHFVLTRTNTGRLEQNKYGKFYFLSCSFLIVLNISAFKASNEMEAYTSNLTYSLTHLLTHLSVRIMLLYHI